MASAHQRTVEYLKGIGEAVNPNGRFIYGREVHGSFDYANNSKPNSESPNPLISLLPFDISDANNPDNNFDSANISLIFTRSADVADNAEREEAIINEMSELAESFKMVLKEGEKPAGFSVSNFRQQAEYLIHMGTNSGVVLTFTLFIMQPCITSANETTLNQFRNRHGNN